MSNYAIDNLGKIKLDPDAYINENQNPEKVLIYNPITGFVEFSPVDAVSGKIFSELSPTKLLISDGQYNAFPGSCVAPNGDWVVVYRKASNHDVGGNGRIVLLRSTDRGRSWTETVIFSNADPDFDYRDPSTTTLSNGNIIMSFFTHTGVDSYNNFLCYTTKSTDNGLTWSTPVLILTGLTYAAVSAQVIELSNGNLLVPTYSSDRSTTHKILINKSTDGGNTWSILSTVVSETYVGLPGSYSTEPVIFELPNGNILITIRNEATGKTTISTSTDGGITWPTPVAKFDSSSRALINLGYNNRIFITYRTKATTEDPNSVQAVIYSDDYGVSFPSLPYVAIDANNAVDEYSTLFSIGGGIFGKVSSIQDPNNTAQADIYIKFVSSNFEVGRIKSLNAEHIRNIGRFFQQGLSEFLDDIILRNGLSNFKLGTNTILFGPFNDEFEFKYSTVVGGVVFNRSGSNEVIIKNDGTLVLSIGTIQLVAQTFANEAAATSGGLTTGTVYKTATGELRIKL